MSQLKEINNFIIRFSYDSTYYKYFKNIELYDTYKLCDKSALYYADNITSFIDNFKITIPKFNEFIYNQLEKSSFKNEVELYKDANIDRKRWSDLVNNKAERPNKDLLFKLAISLKLSINDTDTLLATKGYCINQNRKRDKAICYFIMNDNGKKILNLNPIDRNIKINSILEGIHQAPLY